MTSSVFSASDSESVPDPLPITNGRAKSSAPLANTKYAEMQERRRNFNLSNRLQSTGVSLDIDLPQICVIGSQSTGKSSLIESISGVSLPRASGTCTRCPTECTLTKSEDPWQCAVSLQFRFADTGKELPNIHMIPFGGVITDPSKVEERLRRAQLAILNPALGTVDFPSKFLTDPIIGHGNAISFSSNFISMDIRGPDVADLSFVDLPGIIASVASDGNRGDIEEVKKLANRYCENPNAIILLAVTCETDYENQGATEIQRTHDPDGARTIGVLTKPDRIEKTNEARWLKFLENETESLDNGWYCVKLPGPADLENRISLDEARELEVKFFRQPPWSNHSYRCSVPNLMERLSEILSDSISDRIPQIKADIAKRQKETQDELSRLPPLVTANAMGEVLRLVADFQRAVQKEIDGTASHDGLIQKIRVHEQQFRKDLRGTAPLFVPFESWESSARVPVMDFLAEEERDLGKNGFTKVIYLDEVRERAQNAISRQFPNHPPFDVQRELIMQSIRLWSAPAKKLLAAVQRTLESHFAIIISAHFSDFPKLYRAVQTVLSNRRAECTDCTLKQLGWFLQVETNATFTLNRHYMEDYQSKFEAFYKLIRHRENSYANFIQRLIYPDNALLRTPSPEPQTLASPIMEQYEAASLADDSPIDKGPSVRAYSSPVYAYQEWLPDAPPSVKTAPMIPETDAQKLAKLRAAAIAIGLSPSSWSDARLIKLLPDDEGDGAIKIMADVRAYWQVAFKRYADYIALAVDMDYVRGFGRGLDQILYDQLGLTGNSAQRVCESYFAQPKDIVSMREQLTARLGRLDEAQQELSRFASQE